MTAKQYDKIRRMLDRIAGDKIFSVVFRRRNDKKEGGVVVARAGEERTMRCRLHAAVDVRGVQPDRKDRDRQARVITVYEMAGEASGYKCIPADAIVSINGEEV